MRRPCLILLLFVSATLILGTVGCSKADAVEPHETITGSGVLVSQQRTSAPYTGIRIYSAAKVIIEQGSVSAIRVEADDNIIDRVLTDVENGVLSVRLKEGSYHNTTLHLSLSMKDIDLLELFGAAEIRCAGPIHTPSLTCRVSGAADVALSGTADVQTIEIAGTGDIDNYDLISKDCTVRLSGAGHVHATMSHRLDATISGVGSITYGGNPSIVHRTVSGMGEINPR